MEVQWDFSVSSWAEDMALESWILVLAGALVYHCLKLSHASLFTVCLLPLECKLDEDRDLSLLWSAWHPGLC